MEATTGKPLHAANWFAASPRFTRDGLQIVGSDGLTTQLRRVSDGERLHEFPGRLLTLSRDGSLLVTTKGRQVMVWELESGAQVGSLLGHEQDISAATFDPSSVYLATASYDHTARIWHVQSGANRLAFHTPLDGGSTIGTSADGSRVAVASAPRGRSQVIDLETGLSVRDLPGDVWHPDVRGGRILTTFGSQAAVHDVARGEEVAVFRESRRQILGAHLSPDGRRAALFCDGGPTWLWHINDNTRTTLSDKSQVLEMNWSPSGDFFVTGSVDGKARVWHGISGNQQRALPHGQAVVHVKVHPDSRRLVTVTDNDEAFLWDATTGQQLTRYRAPAGIPFVRVDFSASGQQVFGFQEDLSKGVLCWNTDTGELTGTVSPVRGRVRLTPSTEGSKVLISSSVDGAMLWDPSREPQILTTSATAFASFLGNDRAVLAAFGLDQHPESLTLEDRRRYTLPTLQVRSLADGGLVQEISTAAGRVNWLGVVPDSTRVLVSSEFYGISVFDGRTRESVATLRGHGAPVSFIGFAGDSVITASWDGTAAIWDSQSGALRRWLRGERPLVSAALSADSQYLAAGDAVGNVHAWGLDGDPPRIDLTPHDELVMVAAFAPTQPHRLLTSARNGTTAIHTLSDRVTQTASGLGSFQQIEFAPAGDSWFAVPSNTRFVAGEAPPHFDFGAAPAARQEVVLMGADFKPRVLPTGAVPVEAGYRLAGRELVTIAARQIVFWNVATGERMGEITIKGDPVLAGDVSPDGTFAVTEHRDQISLWNLDSRTEVLSLPAVTPDGRFHETRFDSTNHNILTTAGRQLRSYPVRSSVLAAQAPRGLSSAERELFEILNESDWPAP